MPSNHLGDNCSDHTLSFKGVLIGFIPHSHPFSPLIYIYTYIFIYLYYIYIYFYIYIVSLVKCHWYSTKGRLPHQWVNTAVPPQGPMTGWHRRLKVHRTTGRRTSCDWRLAVGEAGKTWRIWSHFLWVWWWNDPKISWDITDYNPFLTKVSYIYIYSQKHLVFCTSSCNSYTSRTPWMQVWGAPLAALPSIAIKLSQTWIPAVFHMFSMACKLYPTKVTKKPTNFRLVGDCTTRKRWTIPPLGSLVNNPFLAIWDKATFQATSRGAFLGWSSSKVPWRKSVWLIGKSSN